MGWNHYICELCWQLRCKANNEPGRRPVQVKDYHERPCCYCGKPSTSGIFVRENPESAELFCNKFHTDGD